MSSSWFCISFDFMRSINKTSLNMCCDLVLGFFFSFGLCNFHNRNQLSAEMSFWSLFIICRESPRPDVCLVRELFKVAFRFSKYKKFFPTFAYFIRSEPRRISLTFTTTEHGYFLHYFYPHSTRAHYLYGPPADWMTKTDCRQTVWRVYMIQIYDREFHSARSLSRQRRGWHFRGDTRIELRSSWLMDASRLRKAMN